MENKKENLIKTLDESPRSSTLSSTSTSPEKRPSDIQEAYLQSPYHSSASTSPYRCFQKSPETLPTFMSNLRQGLQSQLLSSPSNSPGQALFVIVDGPHVKHLEELSEYTCFGLWWIFLGVASSIGLGSGLHTFVLYLGPHIALFTIKAMTCGQVDLKSAMYDTIQLKRSFFKLKL